MGFGKKVLQQSRCANEVEAWALLHELQMAWDLGIRRLIVEIDSLSVYNWEKGLKELENSLSNVIQECNKNWMVSLKHVYREGNNRQPRWP